MFVLCEQVDMPGYSAEDLEIKGLLRLKYGTARRGEGIREREG